MNASERTEFLYAYASKICPGPDRDDLVQDVLEKTLRTPIPHDVIDERGWLARVTRNRFIDLGRRRAARHEVAAITAPPIAANDETGAPWDHLTEDDVRARIADLPPEQGRTFALFALDGCSYAEIAERLAISKVTVGTRILRARARLRELLEARA